jgi:DNA-binding response OmpR family regulator
MPNNPTVLVLDDDDGVRTSMAALLEMHGYGALTAASLDEARGLIGTASIQALIVDVGLKSGGTGLDLLAMIRERREFDKAPVLVLTGGLLTPSEELLITRCRAFLFYKPEGFDTLVRFLDELTGRDTPH